MSQRNGRPHAAETAAIAGGVRLQVADGDSGLAVCRAPKYATTSTYDLCKEKIKNLKKIAKKDPKKVQQGALNSIH